MNEKERIQIWERWWGIMGTGPSRVLEQEPALLVMGASDSSEKVKGTEKHENTWHGLMFADKPPGS